MAMALLWASALAACSERPAAGLACPVLAPGATAGLLVGATLHPLPTAVEATGALSVGGLAAHPLPLPGDARVELSATVAGAEAVLMAYGPRDAQGGYPACDGLRVGSGPGVPVTLALTAPAEGGEYLVVVGGRPGEPKGGAAAYSLQLTCSDGCDAPATACPSLAELGCPHARCDGALRRDERGCLTCACRADQRCDPEHQAGPWGACVSPACACDDAQGAPVCGADGHTWASPCDALCAGVRPVRDGACATSCPESPSDPDIDCEAPCPGARALDGDGCPTCRCAPALPASPVDCRACGDEEAPVCGSDGVTYRNRCLARCAGARVLYAASCVEGCRQPPPGCDLDCPWGLLLTGTPTSPNACLACACAPAPPADCATSGAAVCAVLPALGGEATTGSPCVALRLGATDATWGPCALPCQEDADCATSDEPPRGGAPDTCSLHGRLVGRCLLSAVQPCGCSALHAPVCGDDGATYENACLAHCAGVSVAQEGACCGAAPPPCPPGEAHPLDAAGCPIPDAACAAAQPSCLSSADFSAPQACGLDGQGLTPPRTACQAHADGLAASPAWCHP